MKQNISLLSANQLSVIVTVTVPFHTYECVLCTDAVVLTTSHFGGGAGPIYLDGVVCSGRESNLMNCSRSSFVSCHSSRRGAGVRCQGRLLMHY